MKDGITPDIGDIIVTEDGILARFGFDYYDQGTRVFYAIIANNIDDNVVRGGIFRLKGWRFATDAQKQRLIDLVNRERNKNLESIHI